ncbi:MAG: FAD-dependent oxidoreductase [Dehalogenimonas sp.]|uniref:FAD-dependent oxidoreductase n=1 Tax=Candidatus Dehalogenimonas loeffleri TaxID=3127115 RepID=A0ABZ2J781_9CHLR|nr:FAD-dependent oxidoreductase [Dehalogenimonas sp.]
MWHFETSFSEIITRAPGVKSFRFPISSATAPFQPGQYFFVTLKVNGEESLHHFTISSAPSDPHLEFTKRITEHPYSLALDAAKPGEKVSIQGPMGNFLLPHEPAKIVFLTGGIGITPVRSMIGYIATKNLDFDIIIICGNQRQQDIVFHDEFELLAKGLSSVRIINVLTEPPDGWAGLTGLINKKLITDTVPDYRERIFYVSGPPKMVMALQEQLGALKIPMNNIVRDSFTGYDD